MLFNQLSITFSTALNHLKLYGDNTLTDNKNTFFLNPVIEYITRAKRYVMIT